MCRFASFDIFPGRSTLTLGQSSQIHHQQTRTYSTFFNYSLEHAMDSQTCPIPASECIYCRRGAYLNPFTRRTPLEPNVCYFHTFENNLRTKRKFTEYLKESCSLASDKHFSLKCFPENAFESNIFSNLSGLFWLL